MASKYENFFEKDYQKLLEKYDNKSEKYKQLKYEYQLLQSQLNTRDKQLKIAIDNFEANAKAKYQPLLDEKDKQLLEKDKEIARLKALLNIDGKNVGIPTSQTPINRKKIIPNTRVKSNKNKGGQKGHKKHKLEKFSEEEINDNEKHELSECPNCGGDLSEIGEITKDELSYRFVPIKRRHHFIEYECDSCHKKVHENIPTDALIRLMEDNPYTIEEIFSKNKKNETI